MLKIKLAKCAISQVVVKQVSRDSYLQIMDRSRSVMCLCNFSCFGLGYVNIVIQNIEKCQ